MAASVSARLAYCYLDWRCWRLINQKCREVGSGCRRAAALGRPTWIFVRPLPARRTKNTFLSSPRGETGAARRCDPWDKDSGGESMRRRLPSLSSRMRGWRCKILETPQNLGEVHLTPKPLVPSVTRTKPCTLKQSPIHRQTAVAKACFVGL